MFISKSLLHHAACNIVKKPGTMYYLFQVVYLFQVALGRVQEYSSQCNRLKPLNPGYTLRFCKRWLGLEQLQTLKYCSSIKLNPNRLKIIKCIKALMQKLTYLNTFSMYWLCPKVTVLWFTRAHEQFHSCSREEGVLWSCKIRPTLWIDPAVWGTTVFLGFFPTLILMKQCSVATLVHITHTQNRTGRFLKMLIFICPHEASWQYTLKLITHCLQQLLKFDKCLKQLDYISRRCSSWGWRLKIFLNNVKWVKAIFD